MLGRHATDMVVYLYLNTALHVHFLSNYGLCA